MLQFCKNNKIIFDGEELKVDDINFEEFYFANLSTPIYLEEGITLEELSSFFSKFRDFIYKYFLEYYDRLNVLILSSEVKKNYQKIVIFKKIVIESGYLSIEPSLDLIELDEDNVEKKGQIKFLGQLPVFIDNKPLFIDDEMFNNTKLPLKVNITLQDLLDSLYSDLIYSLTEGFIE